MSTCSINLKIVIRSRVLLWSGFLCCELFFLTGWPQWLYRLGCSMTDRAIKLEQV